MDWFYRMTGVIQILSDYSKGLKTTKHITYVSVSLKNRVSYANQSKDYYYGLWCSKTEDPSACSVFYEVFLMKCCLLCILSYLS